MEKRRIGAKTFLYPMPVVLVGASVKGKPNYITIAYCGIARHSPPMISIACGRRHYTTVGIEENGTFSVNIPSEEMVEVTDYIGTYSGKSVDKSGLFETFYGVLKTAPMIKECPLNLECRVVQAVEIGGIKDIYIGEIVETYIEEKYLTDNLPDIKKMKPFVFSMHDNNYWKIGEHLGRAWSVGREFKRKSSQ
jgi:flavin reductase (DIM6/NTAB) family NADH-FMN oxidoreductase RutF